MNENPHPVDLHLGKVIRNERRSKGISQGELARRVGVTFQQIQKYEKAANRVSVSMLFEISRALEIGLSSFFEDIYSDPMRTQQATDISDSVAVSREGILLSNSFFAIRDERIRRKLLALVRVIARAESSVQSDEST